MIEERVLGRSGVRVSALGFGCGAVGGLMVRGEAADQRRAVARALEAGISYFDTAPAYGDGRSEENLGRVLEELRADPVVGTKFRVEPGETDISGAIRRSLEISLRRLRMQRVHLLQLHNRIGNDPGSLAPDLVLGKVFEGLRAVQNAGLVERIGVTATGETEAVRRVIDAKRFDAAQVYFNALNPSAGYAGRVGGDDQDYAGLIDSARDNGVGVINIRPLAAGALSGRSERHSNAGNVGDRIAGTAYSDDLTRAATFADLAGRLGLENPVELALRFVLSKDGVSTVLVGISDQTQLDDAIRWAERGPLDSGAVEQILAAPR